MLSLAVRVNIGSAHTVYCWLWLWDALVVPLRAFLVSAGVQPICKRLGTAAKAAVKESPAPQSLPQGRPLLLTLERSVGNAVGSDQELLATRAFQAEVFPDLPIATSWRGLLRKAW